MIPLSESSCRAFYSIIDACKAVIIKYKNSYGEKDSWVIKDLEDIQQKAATAIQGKYYISDPDWQSHYGSLPGGRDMASAGRKMDEEELNRIQNSIDFSAGTWTPLKDEARELIRLARLGLWAEKHGIPALKYALISVGVRRLEDALESLPKGAQS